MGAGIPADFPPTQGEDGEDDHDDFGNNEDSDDGEDDDTEEEEDSDENEGEEMMEVDPLFPPRTRRWRLRAAFALLALLLPLRRWLPPLSRHAGGSLGPPRRPLASGRSTVPTSVPGDANSPASAPYSSWSR